MKRTPLPAHDFPEEGEVRTCRDCGAEWDTREYDDPPPWSCRRAPLESTGTLDRSKGLSPVSDRRQEKRSSPVTGEKLVMIPEVVEWIKRQTCFMAEVEWVDHECEVYGGRDRIEVAHLMPRGKGYGDFSVVGGRVMLNVVSACPKIHDVLDRQRDPPEGLDHSEVEELAALWVAQHQDEAPDPPEHYQQVASGEIV